MLVINSNFIIINSDFITLKLFYRYYCINGQFIGLSSTVLQSCAITFNQFLQPFVFSYFLYTSYDARVWGWEDMEGMEGI